MFGLAFGACKFGKSHKVWRWAPYLVLTATVAAIFAFSDSKALSDYFLPAVFAFLSMTIGLKVGSAIYSELRKRVKASRLFLWSAAALAPYAAISFFCKLGPELETMGYFLSLTAAVAIATVVTKARNRTAAILAGTIATLPILLANALNVCWGLFDAGTSHWRSFCSASALSIVAALAVCSGAAVGLYLVKQKAAKLALKTEVMIEGHIE